MSSGALMFFNSDSMLPTQEMDNAAGTIEDLVQMIGGVTRKYNTSDFAVSLSLAGYNVDYTIPVDAVPRFKLLTLEDLGEASISYNPTPKYIELDAGEESVLVPWIHREYSLGLSNQALKIAGTSREEVYTSQMAEIMNKTREKMTFIGTAKTPGLMNAANATSVTPTANYGTATDGILENWLTDLDTAIIGQSEAGWAGLVNDLVCSPKLYTRAILQQTKYNPLITNMDLIKKRLNGGNVYPSRWLTEDQTVLSWLMVPRLGAAGPINFVNSGVSVFRDMSMYNRGVGYASRCAVKNLLPEVCRFATSIVY